MADLEVQPKRSNLWWLWVLVLLIAIAIVFYLVKGHNTASADRVTTDSTTTNSPNK